MKTGSFFGKKAMTVVKFGILVLGAGALVTSIYFANKENQEKRNRSAQQENVALIIKSKPIEMKEAFTPLETEEIPIIKKREPVVNRPIKKQTVKEVKEVLAVKENIPELLVDRPNEIIEPEIEKVTYKVVKPEISKATYAGGYTELAEFIADEFSYPKEARELRQEGVVVVGFIVDQYGEVKDVHIIKGVSPALDSEAKRIVSMLPNWEPRKVNNIPIRTKVKIPIRFELK
jgi:periplasmic protein TonB